jgi:HPt (histidine-containing phosphotransfer) domain-containing protein
MYQVVESRHDRGSVADVLDLPALVDRCMGKADFAQRLLVRFQAQLIEDVKVMAQAAGADELALVAQIAHRIKGASANISASALMKVAAEIEQAARSADHDTLWSRLPILSAEKDRFQQTLARLKHAAAVTA